MKLQNETCENGIETPLSFIAPKGGIDPGGVDFRLLILVLLDGQFFPLTVEVQELQNIVEDRVQRELWLRTTAAEVLFGLSRWKGKDLKAFRQIHPDEETRNQLNL